MYSNNGTDSQNATVLGSSPLEAGVGTSVRWQIVMRLYWPKTEPPSILPPGEGTWKPPAHVAAK
jgi:hypothetical protein